MLLLLLGLISGAANGRVGASVSPQVTSSAAPGAADAAVALSNAAVVATAFLATVDVSAATFVPVAVGVTLLLLMSLLLCG